MVVEDKNLGIVVSENAEEALWLDAKKRASKAITEGTCNILINEKILELAEQELKKYTPAS